MVCVVEGLFPFYLEGISSCMGLSSHLSRITLKVCGKDELDISPPTSARCGMRRALREGLPLRVLEVWGQPLGAGASYIVTPVPSPAPLCPSCAPDSWLVPPLQLLCFSDRRCHSATICHLSLFLYNPFRTAERWARQLFSFSCLQYLSLPTLHPPLPTGVSSGKYG